ncbi:MAG: 4-hydroxy-3-methylbut-2-enyl diphosphate reductase, partial [Bacteroidetes bacterium]|nr:4-hydroxy-3-methylbut-2-enyl diphosphate reductase [Bacteroidota bacterium]
ALTSGASCPDVLVDEVLLEILKFFPNARTVEDILSPFDETVETES